MSKCKYCNKEIKTSTTFPAILCCSCGSFCDNDCMNKYHAKKEEIND